MALGDVPADILQGYFTQAEFDANTGVTLGAGQVVFLAGTDKFKRGDGVTVLSALPWRGNVWGLISGTLTDQADLLATLKKLAFPPIISGQYRGYPGVDATTLSNLAANIFTTTYFVGVDHTVSKIRIEVTTAVAGGKIRLALYNNSVISPSTLIEQSLEIDASTTGEKEFVFTTPVALTGTYFHMAIQVSSNAIAIRGYSRGVYFLPRTAGAAPHARYFAAQAFGDFPSTFQSPTSGATNAIPMLDLLVV